jgi:DNA-binding response OmpR family regulator
MTDGRSSPPTPRGSACILIIEDEVLIAALIRDLVRGLGYAVSGTAHTVSAARQELAKRAFDIALLDMGLDGPQP